jgi:hypothetical protein
MIETLSSSITLTAHIRGLPLVHALGVTPQLCAFSSIHHVPTKPLLKYLTKLETVIRERGTKSAIL